MGEPAADSVAYVTDVEGQWERLAGFVARTPSVRLAGDRLELARGTTLVFGGDAIDRGPASRRLVRTLLEAKRRYGPRLVLLAGNRDLNKLRLVRELDGHPPARAPVELHADRPGLLRFILSRTMGAGEAFGHRATELAAEGLPSDDRTVVDSFLADLAPDGELSRYLGCCQLAYRHGATLFLHGGLTEESLGHVPGEGRVAGVDAWVEKLNAFCRAQVGAFLARSPGDLADPPWAPIIAYQAPAPGLPSNPASVVYGRLSDELNNPSLPSPAVIRALADAGLGRLVLGHTPSGDTPAVLRTETFELVIADNSRGRVTTGSSVVIEGDALSVRGQVALDSGEALELACRLLPGEAARPLGWRTRDTFALVKGVAADGRYVLYRGLPGHLVEQVAVAPEALADRPLERAWPPAG